MKEIKTGGPAFPMGANEYAGHGPCWGMSLRDYFAAKAMQAMSGGNWPGSIERPEIAKRAYLMADEMIKAGDI